MQGRRCWNIELRQGKGRSEAGEVGRDEIIMAFLCHDDLFKHYPVCSCSTSRILCPALCQDVALSVERNLNLIYLYFYFILFKFYFKFIQLINLIAHTYNVEVVNVNINKVA